ncbi:MAG: hypothetical protein FD123_2630 [Bacteroidetes bacterium]|nr:MAG: hypothetical protein FD123_2630 [Bacteroidota bacterium]
MKHIMLPVIGMFLAVCPVAAKTGDSLVSGKIAALTSVWLQHNGYSLQPRALEPFTVVSRVFDAPPASTNSPVSSSLVFQQQLYSLRMQQIKGDKGLSLNAGYLENLQPNLSDDDLFYKRRVQTGLDWNILGNGLLANKNKEQVLQNESTIARLKDKEKSSPDQLLLTYNSIIYAFNIQKTVLLEKRKKISEEKLNTIGELYYLHQVPNTKFMESLQQQVQISSQYQLYKAYNDQLNTIINPATLPAGMLPAFDIDQEKLLLLAGIHPSADSIRMLVSENFRLQSALTNDMRLAANLRYNYYDMINITNRGFFSAGLNFSVPIRFQKTRNEQLIEVQQNLQQEEQRYVDQQLRLNIANYFYEFRYKLKQYADLAEKRKLYIELIRIERVKQQFGDLEFNPLTALTLLDDLLAIDIEMTDVSQQLYLKLLDIKEQLPGTPVSEYIMPYRAAAAALPQRPAQRSIYIWSKAVKDHSNSMIVEYLRYQKIGTAMVSVNKEKAPLAKTFALIDSLANNKIAVELLAGNNNLIKKDITVYLDSLSALIGTHKINGIHLDVEPHTLADWDTKKTEYLDAYVDMLRKARQYCNRKGWKLGVSIPVFYPETHLKEIYDIVDEAIIMAYEHPDAEWITKKIAEEMKISPGKTTIAIRAKDFKNRNDMEALMKELAQNLDLSVMALHDFSTLLELDEQKGTGGSD